MSFHSWLGLLAPGTRHARPTIAAGSSAGVWTVFEDPELLKGEGEGGSEGGSEGFEDHEDSVLDDSKDILNCRGSAA